MAVVREQFAVASNIVAAHADTTDEVYTVARPLTLPKEGNTIDFVARPSARDEYFQGKLFLEANAVLGVAGAAVRKIEIYNLDNSLARTVVDVTDNTFDLSLDLTKDLLKSILLREDEERLELTVRNDTGGGLMNTQFLGRLDLGLNTANYGSLPLNI